MHIKTTIKRCSQLENFAHTQSLFCKYLNLISSTIKKTLVVISKFQFNPHKVSRKQARLSEVSRTKLGTRTKHIKTAANFSGKTVDFPRKTKTHRTHPKRVLPDTRHKPNTTNTQATFPPSKVPTSNRRANADFGHKHTARSEHDRARQGHTWHSCHPRAAVEVMFARVRDVFAPQRPDLN